MSHGRHDVSRTSRRLTDVTTSHGHHDVSQKSRRPTEVTTPHGGHAITDVTTSHVRHGVSRTSRRLTDVTTFHGRHDVSQRSRCLTEVATSHRGHLHFVVFRFFPVAPFLFEKRAALPRAPRGGDGSLRFSKKTGSASAGPEGVSLHYIIFPHNDRRVKVVLIRTHSVALITPPNFGA